MSRVIYSPVANDDLDEIVDYLERFSPDFAERLVRTIRQKSRVHGRFPELGRQRDDLFQGLRSFAVGKYVVFFRPRPRGIDVVRILHGSRNITPSLFR